MQVGVLSAEQLLDQRERQLNERELKLNTRELLLNQAEKDLIDKSRQLTELANYSVLKKNMLEYPSKQRPNPLQEMQVDTRNATPQKENMLIDTPTKVKWIRQRSIDQSQINSPVMNHKPRGFLPVIKNTFQNYRSTTQSNTSSCAATPLKSRVGSPMSTTESPFNDMAISPISRANDTSFMSMLPIRKLKL